MAPRDIGKPHRTGTRLRGRRAFGSVTRASSQCPRLREQHERRSCYSGCPGCAHISWHLCELTPSPILILRAVLPLLGKTHAGGVPWQAWSCCCCPPTSFPTAVPPLGPHSDAQPGGARCLRRPARLISCSSAHSVLGFYQQTKPPLQPGGGCGCGAARHRTSPRGATPAPQCG